MSFDRAESEKNLESPAVEIAIELSDIAKCYQIYQRPQDRLKQSIVSRIRRWTRTSARQYFREFWALKSISFQIRKGETVGIVGRNGSGKSTLLQILCGTLNPTSGEVNINGRVGALLELGSGFNPEFTGRENIYMNAAVLGLSPAQIADRFEQIVAFAEIGDFIEQPVKTYSSGMYVRLAFAVIAHADADILVIDEALSVGDVFFGQKCMRFLRDFMRRGTVIFVSHDTSAILNLCDRVIWLQNGEIVGEGDAKEVIGMYLEDLYYEDIGAHPLPSAQPQIESGADSTPRDMRHDMPSGGLLRNDIEIFDFSHGTRAFGVGHATIVDAGFYDDQGRPFSWIIGGEPVRLTIRCRAVLDLVSPIVGFETYDRLGQTIFADNTYLTTQVRPVHVRAGELIVATFDFRMPIMREGEYTISVAIAEGTQEDHVQHHWVHDALAFHVHTRSICLGLVGVPMHHISLSVSEAG